MPKRRASRVINCGQHHGIQFRPQTGPPAIVQTQHTAVQGFGGQQNQARRNARRSRRGVDHQIRQATAQQRINVASGRGQISQQRLVGRNQQHRARIFAAQMMGDQQQQRHRTQRRRRNQRNPRAASHCRQRLGLPRQTYAAEQRPPRHRQFGRQRQGLWRRIGQRNFADVQQRRTFGGRGAMGDLAQQITDGRGGTERWCRHAEHFNTLRRIRG